MNRGAEVLAELNNLPLRCQQPAPSAGDDGSLQAPTDAQSNHITHEEAAAQLVLWAGESSAGGSQADGRGCCSQTGCAVSDQHHPKPDYIIARKRECVGQCMLCAGAPHHLAGHGVTEPPGLHAGMVRGQGWVIWPAGCWNVLVQRTRSDCRMRRVQCRRMLKSLHSRLRRRVACTGG